MNNPRTRFSLLLFGIAAASASATGQQSKPAPAGTTAPSGTPAPRHIACWKQVGISPAVIQQRRAIMEAAKSKIEGICGDDSLTAPQKKEQIHQIHQEAVQQAEGLIPGAQMEALKKCQASYSTGSHHATTPCGEPLEPEEPTTTEPN